jgi:hypothetical protein
MTTYGYARVSTNGQDLTSQEHELLAAGCAKVFKEKVSGAKTDRAELAKVISKLQPGDVLVVTRLDRLARSTRDLLNVLATISERQAGFRSLKDTWADTTTPHGRLMLTVLGGLAEFERECPYRRRQKACEGPWREIRTANCTNSAPTARSNAEACMRRSAGRCSAVLQCFAGHNIAAWVCVMSAKLLAGIAALSMLLAGAALAGSCQTFCGEFAGYHWCNTTCR